MNFFRAGGGYEEEFKRFRWKMPHLKKTIFLVVSAACSLCSCFGLLLHCESKASLGPGPLRGFHGGGPPYNSDARIIKDMDRCSPSFCNGRMRQV